MNSTKYRHAKPRRLHHMNNPTTFRPGQLLDILGVSRDALRYYEEKGIVKPNQKQTNNYREYDLYDIYTLMVTDFYKKRNLSINEVKQLQAGSELEELETLLSNKAEDLEAEIRKKEYILRKITETKEFCQDIQTHLNKCSPCNANLRDKRRDN